MERRVTPEQVRAFRLRAHHLDRKAPPEALEEAAGACGVQNSPPDAWETALFHRVEGATLESLRDALYREKRLLQAWSCRGVPMVFPTAESGVFLTPLAARPGEEPWIYTRGVTAALEVLHMTFEELLPLVKEAVGTLEGRTVRSKEALDRVLAECVAERLPGAAREKWNGPSMYGSPDRQTVGGAVASFLLRPCSFLSLVVFGERGDGSPTFTTFQSWTGRPPGDVPDADRALTRKFLHCYGPATLRSFGEWLGASPQQAARIWSSASEELEPVQVAGRRCYVWAGDLEDLLTAGECGDRLLLLGPHDPYLDLRDRSIILEDMSHGREVWRTVANPGVILQNGVVIGTWRGRTRRDRLEVALTTWAAPRGSLEALAEEYAAFRHLSLGACTRT